MNYQSQIDKSRMPRHVAIIMDGNGRWAKKQGLARMYGHKQGVETVHRITETAAALGIQYLTLYTFSTANWNRPKEEVDALMTLLVFASTLLVKQHVLVDVPAGILAAELGLFLANKCRLGGLIERLEAPFLNKQAA